MTRDEEDDIIRLTLYPEWKSFEKLLSELGYRCKDYVMETMGEKDLVLLKGESRLYNVLRNLTNDLQEKEKKVLKVRGFILGIEHLKKHLFDIEEKILKRNKKSEHRRDYVTGYEQATR